MTQYLSPRLASLKISKRLPKFTSYILRNCYFLSYVFAFIFGISLITPVTNNWSNCEESRLLKLLLESVSHQVMSDSLWPHGLYSPWNSPCQNTGVGSLSLLQRVVPTQGSNPGLLHCRWILYQLSTREALVGSHQRRQRRKEKIYPFECRVPKNRMER